VAGTGAVVGAGIAVGARSDGGAAAAEPAAEEAILNLFLLLERLQERFYREALRTGRLGEGLRQFATAAAGQEAEHVAFLTRQLGRRARRAPEADFASALRSPEAFSDAAIALEEAAIAAYVGQAANLRRELVGPIGTVTSVEARHAAWVRDLAGISPAPAAADPAGEPDRILAGLRDRGLLA
jgi:rubrerythrin